MDQYENIERMCDDILSGHIQNDFWISGRGNRPHSCFNLDLEFIWRYYRILDLNSANAAVVPMLKREFEKGFIRLEELNELLTTVYHINILLKSKEMQHATN